MATKLKFADIETAAQLRTRVVEDVLLSCGNQYSRIRHLLTRTGAPEDGVCVYYTAGNGNHCIIRYIVTEATQHLAPPSSRGPRPVRKLPEAQSPASPQPYSH